MGREYFDATETLNDNDSDDEESYEDAEVDTWGCNRQTDRSECEKLGCLFDDSIKFSSVVCHTYSQAVDRLQQERKEQEQDKKEEEEEAEEAERQFERREDFKNMEYNEMFDSLNEEKSRPIRMKRRNQFQDDAGHIPRPPMMSMKRLSRKIGGNPTRMRPNIQLDTTPQQLHQRNLAVARLLRDNFKFRGADVVQLLGWSGHAVTKSNKIVGVTFSDKQIKGFEKLVRSKR